MSMSRNTNTYVKLIIVIYKHRNSVLYQDRKKLYIMMELCLPIFFYVFPIIWIWYSIFILAIHHVIELCRIEIFKKPLHTYC